MLVESTTQLRGTQRILSYAREKGYLRPAQSLVERLTDPLAKIASFLSSSELTSFVHTANWSYSRFSPQIP